MRLALRKIADAARKLSGPDFVDIRLHQLTVRTRTWSGSIVGEGTATDSDLTLPKRYPIRPVTGQDVFSSAGVYEVGDIVVSHITPSEGTGVGYTTEQLRPTVTADNIEIIHVITGPHAGDYRCIDVRNYRAFSTQLVLRRRGDTQ